MGTPALAAEAAGKGRSGNRAWAITGGMLRVASPHGLHRGAVGLVRGTVPTMRERLLGLSIPRALIRGVASGPYRGEAELGARRVRAAGRRPGRGRRGRRGG